jgi:CheY-like chemotaxis protein
MIIRDISERINFEKQLLIEKEKAEESDRLKTAFLHNISHEIRTPLNAIVGFAALLTKDLKDQEKLEKYKTIIRHSSSRLLTIVDDIINVSAIETDQILLCEEEVNINSLLNSVIEKFNVIAKEKDLTLTYISEIKDNEAVIITDRNKVREILSNLINNAIKFTPKGSVTVECKRSSTDFYFAVKDTGIGIPSEMQKLIFNQFRQGDMSDVRQYSGLGLGLSISKAFVEKLGGKIWLNSEPEKGSEFNFSLPFKSVVESQKTGTDRISNEPVDFGLGKTVLIAEDDENNFQLLQVIMLGLNLNILRAKNGQEAVDICNSDEQIDLILMDIKMPILDGLIAANKIRAIRPSLPIIAQTAYVSDSDKDLIFEYGFDDFIGKPFSQEQINTKVIQHLLRPGK